MRKTLEDLYYGNIIPHEKRITAKSELQRMIKRAAECEAKLTGMLNDEEKHTLNVLMSTQQEIDGITAIENFISGFRLGVRLMVDCMDDDDGNVTDGR